MERRNRHIVESMDLQPFCLKIHVRGRLFAACSSNPLEKHFEILVEFGTTFCTLGKETGEEDGSVVIECRTKLFPVEIIEGMDELSESITNLDLCRRKFVARLHRVGLSNPGSTCRNQSQDAAAAGEEGRFRRSEREMTLMCWHDTIFPNRLKVDGAAV